MLFVGSERDRTGCDAYAEWKRCRVDCWPAGVDPPSRGSIGPSLASELAGDGERDTPTVRRRSRPNASFVRHVTYVCGPAHRSNSTLSSPRRAIIDLLRKEHAVLWSEAQAKISDVRWPTVPTAVDPHHMTTARGCLLARNRIAELKAPTRGGHEVSVLHLADTNGISTHIDRAAARKRRLMATFQSWLNPRSCYPLGFVGAAGERVTHASLIVAAPHGLRLERPGGGEVSQLLGEEVEGGPLDSVFWVQVTNAVGLPVATVLCPVEVKNIRHWVYPNANELHQLLHKAALLQIRHPDVPICPILITRRKSFSANAMSRALGFRILNVNKQFVLPSLERFPFCEPFEPSLERGSAWVQSSGCPLSASSWFCLETSRADRPCLTSIPSPPLRRNENAPSSLPDGRRHCQHALRLTRRRRHPRRARGWR